MNRWRRYMPVRSIRRISRHAATLSVLPALMLSSLTTQVILIHDHHGHDTHGHTLNARELDKLPSNPQHHHEEHKHDGPTADFADGESSSLVILLELSEGLALGRVLSCRGIANAGSPSARSTKAAAIARQQSDRPYTERPSRVAHAVRARSLLEGILLTSHALLL